MNKKVLISISMFLLLIIIVFSFYTIKCKQNADIIFKNVYADVKTSKIIKEKIGNVDSVYVKNIYHFGQKKGKDYYIDLKIISNGNKYYITSITKNKCMNTRCTHGYIINDKRYNE